VTNLLRLLELAKSVQDMLLDGRLDMGHARALLGVAKRNRSNSPSRWLPRPVRGEPSGWSSSGPMAQGQREGREAAARRRHAPLQDELKRGPWRLRDLKPRMGGRGSLVIDYASLDQLDGIVARLMRALTGPILRCRKF